MQRFYGIEKPLALTWRRFCALMNNMPGDSAFYSRCRAEAEKVDVVSDALRQVDQLQGRRYDRVKRRNINDLLGDG